MLFTCNEYIEHISLSFFQVCDIGSKPEHNPAMLFTCNEGHGRSTVGAVMGYLILTHKSSEQRHNR